MLPILTRMATYDEYITELGRRVREHRVAAGLSLRTCGLMVGVHYNQLQRIEQGKANPSFATLYKIAKGLDIDLCELFPTNTFTNPEDE